VARNRSSLSDYVGRNVILGIRPEDFEDAELESDTPGDRRVKAKAELTEPLGADVLVHFSSDATAVTSSAAKEDVGADAEVSFGGGDTEDAGASSRLVARVSPRTRIREGSPIELVVDTSRLYFFDPETRDAI
jgi:multiple sugar transport system ATP-binding protein